VGAEISALKREPAWQDHGRNARTLAKYPDARFVLEVMRPGTRFAPGGPGERIAVHCLAGRVRVHLPDGGTEEVSGGTLCTLDRFMAIEIEAVQESACLLTVAWPAAA
jgi:hypothetical protein